MTNDPDREVVRQALALTAGAVRPPADLLDRARRAGRRRVRRHRALAGALAVVLLAGGLSAAGYASRPPTVTTTPAAAIGERLLDGPTRGDLAGHPDYLRAVVDLHERARDDSPLRGLGVTRNPAGPAHVTWAGSTMSGRAAVVAQRMRLAGGDRVVLVTFVGTGVDGRPEKVGADFYGSGDRTGWQSVAFLVGPERSTLVVLDVGIEVEFSLNRTYTAGAVTREDWQSVQFIDGVALITLGPQRDRWTVAVRQRAGAYLGIGNLTDPQESTPERGWLDWHRPADADHPAAQPVYLVLGGSAGAVDLPDVAESRRALAETAPFGALEPQIPPSLGRDWIAVGRTPAGAEVVAGDLRIGTDQVRTLVRLHRPGQAPLAVVGPVVDPAAYLPVVVRLPDGRGWLVARPGATLSWSDGRGDWQPAGRDAAVLPAGATQARVGTVAVRLG
ncbi:hypothetical protein ACIBJE_07390 [Micromonospora sp. NPDC050187]|uniref:hypothetical protein n=1 Tax=Micromonospora sp. NPDC050187 TaxID=3364277 RepID=UPI0037ACDC1C